MAQHNTQSAPTAMPPTAQILDMSGNPIQPSTGGGFNAPPPNLNYAGGGGGDDPMKPLWKTDVIRDVQFAKWGLVALLPAFGIAFLHFNSEFKEVRKDIAEIEISTAKQSVKVDNIDETLGRIELKLDKNDDNAKTSSGTEQPSAIREGTPARP